MSGFVRGKASITFEYMPHLKYRFSFYRKSNEKLEFYNVVFGDKEANQVAERLPEIYRQNKIVPQFQIKDESNKTIFDSKWDGDVRNFLR